LRIVRPGLACHIPIKPLPPKLQRRPHNLGCGWVDCGLLSILFTQCPFHNHKPDSTTAGNIPPLQSYNSLRYLGQGHKYNRSSVRSPIYETSGMIFLSVPALMCIHYFNDTPVYSSQPLYVPCLKREYTEPEKFNNETVFMKRPRRKPGPLLFTNLLNHYLSIFPNNFVLGYVTAFCKSLPARRRLPRDRAGPRSAAPWWLPLSSRAVYPPHRS
jgi:hypothetical protein